MEGSATTMKALVVGAYGTAATIQSFARPVLSEGNVLIRVAKASLNPVDFKTRDGKTKALRDAKPPYVVGYDLCGEVVESKHAQTPVGTKLFGRVRDKDMGVVAEYCQANPEFLAVQPPALEDDTAATVGLAGETALQMIRLGQAGKDLAEQTVLVLGGAGGVGHLCVQLLRILGAKEIIATASTTKLDFVKSLGANRVIDYKKEDVAAAIGSQAVDFCLDTVGDATSVFCCVRKGGKCVSVAATPTSEIIPTEQQVANGTRMPPSASIIHVALPIISAPTNLQAWWSGIQYHYLLMSPNRADLESLAKWIVDGKLKVTIAKRFSLDQADQALVELEKGGVVGKLIIDVKQ